MRINDLYLIDRKIMHLIDSSRVNFDALNKLPKNARLLSLLNGSKFDIKNIIYAKLIPLSAVMLFNRVNKNLNLPDNLSMDELFFVHENIEKIIEFLRHKNEDNRARRWFLVPTKITSSDFYQICKSTNEIKTSLSLLNPQHLSNIPTVKHGRNNEKNSKGYYI